MPATHTPDPAIDESAAAHPARDVAAPLLPRRHICPSCGYDLIATITQPHRMCPECGAALQLVDLVERARPWQRVRRSAGLLGLLSLLLIVAADVFFHRQPVGCTLTLFSALLLTAIAARENRFMRGWPGRIALMAFLGLALALLEHPGPLRISMMTLAIFGIASLNRDDWTPSVIEWGGRLGEMMTRIFFQLPRDAVLAHRWTRAHGGRGAKAVRTIARWGIPALLSTIFIALFAVANPVIQRWLEGAGNSFSRVFNGFFTLVTIDRVLLWLGMALFSWALLRACRRWRILTKGLASPVLPTTHSARPAAAYDLPALLVRCLVLFNLIFAVQMALDLTMLLSSGAMLPEGMTYSTYARRGAYPLVATGLLAAAFVLITFPSGRAGEEAAERSNSMRWARRLVFLWIAQNIALTISAGLRLEIYVGAFSLTRLRVAAAIWMLLVAIGLCTIIWRIAAHRTNMWLVRANTVSLLVVLYLCCFINVDGLIAWYDVKHCREAGVADGPHVDRAYLRSLGPEAIEPFKWLQSKTEDRTLAAALQGDVTALRTQLQSDLRAWQGWTWRRARMARVAFE